jgi:outer membrane protein assembly factor BamB
LANFSPSGTNNGRPHAGNIYVAATCLQEDFCVRKLDSNGQEVWTRSYDAPPIDSGEAAIDVAVHADGDVYVIGSELRRDLAQGLVVLLRNYDGDGTEHWTRRYDSPSNGYDVALGVALSGSSVVVAGAEERRDLGTGFDGWLRGYSP